MGGVLRTQRPKLIVFLPIPPGRESEVVGHLAPLIEKQGSLGNESVAEICGMIDEGIAHIAFAWDSDNRQALAFMGWRIFELGSRRIADVMWLAGSDIELWLPLLADGERFFREHERCDVIRAFGRRGWDRMLATHGYRHKYTVIEKELA